MADEKKNRRFLFLAASIPILAAATIALLQNAMSFEPPLEIYRGIYPIAGPLLQVVDAYAYHYTLSDAPLSGWLQYLGCSGLLLFLMYSPAIFFNKSTLFPWCAAASLLAFASWWAWGFVIIGIGV
jgi:hypothetical protein